MSAFRGELQRAESESIHHLLVHDKSNQLLSLLISPVGRLQASNQSAAMPSAEGHGACKETASISSCCQQRQCVLVQAAFSGQLRQAREALEDESERVDGLQEQVDDLRGVLKDRDKRVGQLERDLARAMEACRTSDSRMDNLKGQLKARQVLPVWTCITSKKQSAVAEF